MKKILLSLFTFLLFFGAFSFRIWVVNAEALPQEEKIYNPSEWVPLKGDFFYSANENTNGYSIKLISAEMWTCEKFLEYFGKSADYLATNAKSDVLVILVHFKNEGNTDGGVFVRDMKLENTFHSRGFSKNEIYTTIANSPTYSAKSVGIRIKPNTEVPFYLAYTTAQSTNWPSYSEKLWDRKVTTMYLVTSLYPVKKMVRFEIDITPQK